MAGQGRAGRVEEQGMAWLGLAWRGRARNAAIKLIKGRTNEAISNHIERADTTTDA